MEAFISIIVPVYNGERFIQNTYDSIVEQNYANIEIIFIDNGSADNSSIKIQEIIQKDNRVQLYHETKQGAGAARNKGIQRATGELFCFLDCDDFLVKGRLQEQVKALQSNLECDFVLSDTRKVYGDREYIMKLPLPQKELIEGRKQAFKWMSNFGSMPHHCSGLYKAEFVRSIGGYGEELLSGEDAFFLFKAALFGRFTYLSVVHYVYVRYDDSTVSNLNSKMHHSLRYLEQYVLFYAKFLSQKKMNLQETAIVNRVFFFSLINYIKNHKDNVSQSITVFKKYISEYQRLGFLCTLKWKLGLRFHFLSKRIVRRIL